MIENIVVFSILILALGYIYRHFRKTLLQGESSGSGCSKCALYKIAQKDRHSKNEKRQA